MTTFEAKGASESAIDDEQRPQDTAAGGEVVDRSATHSDHNVPHENNSLKASPLSLLS